MATLTSPGVSITTSDESFYAPAGAGTVPLIVISTAQDKSAPDGSGTASYTTSANANKLQLITSQRELLQNYGNPVFKTSGGTALHGNEQNEYGLFAAYSFLGIANRAYVLRADIDLEELTPSTTSPTKKPADGAYWLDASSTTWGIKKYNGTAWELQTVKVPSASEINGSGNPKTAFGSDNDFCVVYYTDAGATASTIKFFQKLSGAWYHLGSSNWTSAVSGSNGDFQFASHLLIPTTKGGGGALTSGDVFLQTTTSNNGSNVIVKKYSTSSAQFTTGSIVLKTLSDSVYANDYPTPTVGDLWADADDSNLGTINLTRHNGGTSLSATSTTALADGVDLSAHTGKTSIGFKINHGSQVNVTLANVDGSNVSSVSVDDIAASITNALSSNVATASNVEGKLSITVSNGTDLEVIDGNVAGFTASNLNLTAQIYSNFADLSYEASSTAITGNPVEGTLWYDNNVSNTNIDMLYQNAGSWATYSNDVQFAASAPTLQSDGSSSLVTGDLWIDSSNLENFPVIYKRSATSTWVLVDNTDQVSEDGILFADYRASSSGSAYSDAPSAALYPSGMLLWNKSASVGNVKSYDATNSRWVDYSGNKEDGSPYMMRKAQRKAVTKALQSTLNSNDTIRNESNRFNILAVPGYGECLDEMLALSTSRKDTVFCVADAPFRLAADATSTQNWATNSSTATENGEDGLVSSSYNAAVYYPHGLASNLDGTNVMVPASHMALRTMAFNDQVAFPWFAPAGFQRGLVNNATSTGYLDSTTGEFTAVSLSEGQRDSLYLNKINPVGNFPGRGIAVFGQKTLNPSASALDRINVARLVIYIREQLDDAVKPFLFEPNDEVTRANAKVVVDRFLGQLVTQRGLFDFITVCDTTNNTPARIDRNELHIDIAIQPVKAVEFIYIPIRIQNTLGSTG
jgi:hypothetical protein